MEAKSTHENTPFFIDFIRQKILLAYSWLTLLVLILVDITSFFTAKYNRIVEASIMIVCFPAVVLYFTYKKQLTYARFFLILNSYIIISYVFFKRLSEGVDSHVEINLIELCLIAHLLYDRIQSWLLIASYVFLFFLMRILAINQLHIPFEQEDFVHQFLTISIVSYTSYTAKKSIISIQQIMDSQRDQLVDQKDKLEQTNAFKDRLFNIISHDLRTPIATLKLLLKNLESTYRHNLNVKQVIRHVDSLYLALDNLLHWSRIQSKNERIYYSTVDLKFMIENVLDLFKMDIEHKQLELHLSLQPILKKTDEYLLEIAVRNFIHNAIKFTPSHRTIYIQTVLVNDLARITIQDTGIGMSSAMVNAILAGNVKSQRGTSGEKGTGLGVEISRELLQRLGASLSIQSQVDAGTTICIDL